MRALAKRNGVPRTRSIFDDLFYDWDLPVLSTKHPRADVVSREKDFKIDLEVPGFSLDNLNLEVKDGVLSIKGMVEKDEKKGEGDYRLREISTSSFERSFTLPDGVEADEIEANLENGILTILVPKILPKEPEKVSIKIKGK